MLLEQPEHDLQTIDRYRSKGTDMTDPAYIPHPRIPGATTPFVPPRIASKSDTPVERIPLFYLDDVEYSIPREVPASYTVAFLQDVTVMGENAAVAMLMSRLIGGDEAMNALRSAEGMTNEQLGDILTYLRGVSLAAAKRATGK